MPFSIQPDQVVQHVIEVAEGLQQPTEAADNEDEASVSGRIFACRVPAKTHCKKLLIDGVSPTQELQSSCACGTLMITLTLTKVL